MLFELTGAGRPDGASLTVADDGITATGGTAPTWTTVSGWGKAIRFPTGAIASTVWKDLDGTSRICKLTFEMVVDASPTAAMVFLDPRHGSGGATRSGSAVLNTGRTQVGRGLSDVVFSVVTASTAMTLNDVYVVQYVIDAGTTSSNGRGMMRVTHKATSTVVYEASSTGMSNANVALTQGRIGKFSAVSAGILMRNVRIADDSTYAYLDPMSDGSSRSETINDSVGITDIGLVQVIDSAASTSDSMSLTDNANAVADRVRSINDPVGISDSTSTIFDQGRSVDDPVGLTDATSTVSDQTEPPTDNAGIIDNVASISDRVRSAADNVGINDAAASTADRIRPIDDPEGITDATTAAADRVRTINDGVGIVDETFPDRSSSGASSTTDGVPLSDSVTTVSVRDRSAADPVGVSDAMVAVSTRDRTANDNVGMTDSVGVVWNRAATVSDGIGIVDAANVVANRTATIADVIGITDEAAKQFWQGLATGWFHKTSGALMPVTVYIKVDGELVLWDYNIG